MAMRPNSFLRLGKPYLSGATPTATLYVIGSPSGPTKVGITGADPYRRLKALQTGSPVPLDVFAYTPVPANRGFGIEHEVHKYLADKRMNGEWFNLPPADVVMAVEGILQVRCKRPERLQHELGYPTDFRPGDLAIYLIEPIEKWDGWQKPLQLYRNPSRFELGDAHRISDWCILWARAQAAALKLGWQGDILEGPYVTVLPPVWGDVRSPVAVAWKQPDRHTFVSSPLSLPWLKSRALRSLDGTHLDVM